MASQALRDNIFETNSGGGNIYDHSGAPGGDLDKECAEAGLFAIEDDLAF